MLPHVLLVVACRQPPVDPRFRHGSRAGSSAGVSAALPGGKLSAVLIANSLLSCRDGRMTCLAVPRVGEATAPLGLSLTVH